MKASAPRLHLLIPGDLATVTGGYIYDRRMVEGLTKLGWTVSVHTLHGSFPEPNPAALKHAESVLTKIPDRELVMVDGLALGGMPELLQTAASRLRLVALIHHPLAQETGLSRAQAAILTDREQRALATVNKVVVTSRSTAAALADYGVPAVNITVVEPGTDSVPLAKGSNGPKLMLLCVASLIPRKGHALLLDALSELTDRPWHLWCAGNTTLDPSTTTDIKQRLQSPALTGRVTLLGALDQAKLAEHYQSADLFVLPTYHEGYGMALSEALARGLPILSTRAGAVPDTVPPQAGLLVRPGDAEALSAALKHVMDEPGVLAQLAAGARAARSSLPTWELAAERMAVALQTS